MPIPVLDSRPCGAVGAPTFRHLFGAELGDRLRRLAEILCWILPRAWLLRLRLEMRDHLLRHLEVVRCISVLSCRNVGTVDDERCGHENPRTGPETHAKNAFFGCPYWGEEREELNLNNYWVPLS